MDLTGLFSTVEGTASTIGTKTSGAIGFIPNLLEGFRNVVGKLGSVLGLSESTSVMVVAAMLALFFAYLWFKQWITTSVFFKLSTILNYILLALVFYLVIVYV